MPEKNSAKMASYDYGIVRVVPSLERGEFINVGVILYCRTQRYLDARVALLDRRFRAFAPELDRFITGRIQDHIIQIPKICAGAGPVGQLEQAERFHWLVALRSAMIQVSPVHSGLCEEPEQELERLFEVLVLRASEKI